MVDVENAPEVLDGFGGFFVLHGKDKLEEALKIEFAVDCLVFLIKSVDDNARESSGIFT